MAGAMNSGWSLATIGSIAGRRGAMRSDPSVLGNSPFALFGLVEGGGDLTPRDGGEKSFSAPQPPSAALFGGLAAAEKVMNGSKLVGRIQLNGSVSIARSRRHWRPRQLLLLLAAPIVLFGAGVCGRYYWTTGRFLVTTDDATVQADSVIISPKVSSYIAEVRGRDFGPCMMGRCCPSSTTAITAPR